jgi:hypothetical protein
MFQYSVWASNISVLPKYWNPDGGKGTTWYKGPYILEELAASVFIVEWSHFYPADAVSMFLQNVKYLCTKQHERSLHIYNQQDATSIQHFTLSWNM